MYVPNITRNTLLKAIYIPHHERTMFKMKQDKVCEVYA